MIPPVDEESSRHCIQRVGLAVFAAALVISIYDLGLTAWQPEVGVEGILDLVRFTPLLIVAIPITFALPAALLARLELTLGLRTGAQRAVRFAVDLVVASPLLALVPGLFSGPAIRSCPWRWPAMIAVMLIVVGLTKLGRLLATWWARWARRVTKHNRRQSLPIVVSVAGLSLGIAIPHGLTVWILPGLYANFHQALALVAIGISAGCIFALLATSQSRILRRRSLFAAIIVAVVAWPTGAWLTRGAALGRQHLAAHAPFAGSFTGQLYSVSRLISPHRWQSESATESSGGLLNTAVLLDNAPQRDVLVITIDALRGDALGQSGKLSSKTPLLSRLADTALRFRRAYSPSNYTPYSIPGLMMGFVPQSQTEIEVATTIADVFGRGGYRTELYFTAHEYASLEHTAVWPLAARGFDFQYYHPEYSDAAVVMEQVERLLDTNKDPVFVWAHLSDVHAPYLLRRRLDSPAAAFPASYTGQLEYLDTELGRRLTRIVARHRELHWVLTADHGESLGERGKRFHGSSLFDEQVRVPLLIGGPGVEPGVVTAPVSNMTLPATLLKLVGARLPEEADTLPLSPHDTASAPVLIVGRRERCAIVEGQDKLIASPAEGIVALYDLNRDPRETKNLIRQRPTAARRLLQTLPRLGCPFDISDLDALLE